MFFRSIVKRSILSVAVLSAFCFTATQAAEAQSIPGCTSIISLPSSLIYKGCAGSGHLAKDPRGRGVALIAKLNATLRAPSCIRVLDFQGNQISGLRAYPGNNGLVYKYRHYSNFVRGCGGGDTMQSIRQKSQNKEIYLQMTGGTCIKLSKSFQNVNSNQKTCQ